MNAIQLKPVQSSNIAQIGYDAAAQILAIQFTNGKKVYQYKDVPQEIYDGFSEGSAGSHFAKNVRGKFEHTIVDGESA